MPTAVRTITRAEWERLHPDYRDVVEGQRYMLCLEAGDTRLVPVVVAEVDLR